jgi:hypothetical protein
MQPDRLGKLPGLGYAAKIMSPVSAAARVTEESIPGRPTRACKRMVMHDDVDLDDSSDDDGEIVIGPPWRRKNIKPISYTSMHTNCRRWNSKATALKEEMEMVQRQHERTSVIELTATTNKCLTLKNNIELAELAHSEFEMVSDELVVSKKELKVAKDDLSSTTGRLFLMTRKYEGMHNNYQHVATQLSH